MGCKTERVGATDWSRAWGGVVKPCQAEESWSTDPSLDLWSLNAVATHCELVGLQLSLVEANLDNSEWRVDVPLSHVQATLDAWSFHLP